jgi:hypothetical protein
VLVDAVHGGAAVVVGRQQPASAEETGGATSDVTVSGMPRCSKLMYYPFFIFSELQTEASCKRIFP